MHCFFMNRLSPESFVKNDFIPYLGSTNTGVFLLLDFADYCSSETIFPQSQFWPITQEFLKVQQWIGISNPMTLFSS